MSTALVDRLNAALPQTQCTRCGYPDCRAYAEAMATGAADINQCPPGGAEGVVRLATLTGRPAQSLNPEHGVEGPRLLAVIDEAWCIGCTLCLKACPVDAITGAAKRMHTVIDPLCTGCELCLPACPVDCISLVNTSGEATGWAAWSGPQAAEAADRYDFHRIRLQRDDDERSARLAARRALSPPTSDTPPPTIAACDADQDPGTAAPTIAPAAPRPPESAPVLEAQPAPAPAIASASAADAKQSRIAAALAKARARQLS